MKDIQFYANLHMHSTHSDGVYTPAELVKVAKKEGYKALAITDHDTATAYPELVRACKEEGMECIFGVEFCVSQPHGYHILGFNFDPEYPPMKEYLQKMGARETHRTKCCFDEAVAKGDITGITWEEVLEFNKDIIWLCNDHIYRLLVAKGLAKMCDYDAWFMKNFAEQRDKYPRLYEPLHLRDLVKLIKEAGGIVLVAHPHGLINEIVDICTEYNIDGFEVFNPDLTPDEQEAFYKVALEHGYYISGGSDHSGLCGGLYGTFRTEEELKKSEYYIPEMSAGTTKEYYEELKNMKIER